MTATPEKTKENPNSKLITLDVPIKRGETEIKELTLRKPSSGELRGLSLLELMQMDVNAVRKVLTRITVPPLVEHEVNQMDIADVTQCSVGIASFLLTKEQKAASQGE